MDIQAKIDTMTAFRDGKVIESRFKDSGSSWGTCVNPVFDFHEIEYRVKKEPEMVYKVKSNCNTEVEIVYEGTMRSLVSNGWTIVKKYVEVVDG